MKTQRQKEGAPLTAGYVRGLMKTHNVPAKVVAEKSGIHPTQISKFLTGGICLTDYQLVDLALAVGVASVHLRTQKKPRAAATSEAS